MDEQINADERNKDVDYERQDTRVVCSLRLCITSISRVKLTKRNVEERVRDLYNLTGLL